MSMSCLDTRIGVYNMIDHYELPVSFSQSVRHLKVTMLELCPCLDDLKFCAS